MTPAALVRMRALWEGSPEMSAAVIGERFGVSKNVVIGNADRRGWAKRPARNQNTRPASPAAGIPKPVPRVPRRYRHEAPADCVHRTLYDRLDALDRALDGVLRETAAVVEAERAKMRAAAEHKATALLAVRA